MSKIFTTKNNKQLHLRKLQSGDSDSLYNYLNGLSDSTRKRFGPHAFDKQSIADFYQDESNTGYLAIDQENSSIVAYSIIKSGYLEHDSERLRSYGIEPNRLTDCTFAPSVGDAWQSAGIGNAMFQHILTDLKYLNIKRIILWGGVQADNIKAVNYYKKYGFRTLGAFEHNGKNYDMVLDL